MPSGFTSVTRHAFTERLTVSAVFVEPSTVVRTSARCETFQRTVSPGANLYRRVYFGGSDFEASDFDGSAIAAATRPERPHDHGQEADAFHHGSLPFETMNGSTAILAV